METKIIQITAGRGPIECCRVVAKILDKIIKDLKNEKILYDVISTSKTNINGTYYSAAIKICSVDLNKIISKWNGTIKWIAQSPYRKYHKRKNWYIGVQFFDLPKSYQWNDKDVKYETCRASGPGGQHVNKVESAVRAIHIPTGISVLVMESRSQHQNKKISLERLHSKFESNFIEELIKNQQNQWQEHNELERGNELIVFEESL